MSEEESVSNINELDVSHIIEILDEKIGLYFTSTATPFTHVEKEHFLNLIETLRSVDPKKLPFYKPPTRQTLSSSILPKIHAKVEQVKKKLLNDTDSCLLCDGWKNKSNKIKQLVFTLRNIKVPQVFLCSFNVSKESEDAISLSKNFEEAIKLAKEEYNTIVVATETDNDAKIKAGARLAKNTKKESLLQATCSSHSGNLLLKEIVDNEFESQVKIILNAFSSPKMVALIHQANGTALQSWSDTRFCYFRDSCESIKKNFQILHDIYMIEDVHLPEEVGELLISEDFKQKLNETITNLKPVCKLINSCQNPQKNIADAVHLWLDLSFPNNKWGQEVSKRISSAVSEAAWSAYLIHPKYKGQKLNAIQLNITRMFLNDKLDDEGRDELQSFLQTRNEVDNSMGQFCNNSDTYWTQLEFIFPKLSKLCLQLLILPASTALIESFFSEWSYVMNPHRNRLSDNTSSLCVDIYHLSKHLKNGIWCHSKRKKRKRSLSDDE